MGTQTDEPSFQDEEQIDLGKQNRKKGKRHHSF
jgi:hypothetical protein